MKLKELYGRAVETGMENDPRGREAVLKGIEDKKKQYGELKEKDKEFFDTESLSNPYADSRIVFGTGEEEVTCALVGIDIEVGEVLLAHAMNSKGAGIDLLIAHHPEGRPYANLYNVMHMQADILSRFGVPISTAEALMEKRISEVERRLLPANHTRAVDAARLLGVPMVNFHTPADNMVTSYLQRAFEEKKPDKVSDIVDLLMEMPEYRDSAGHGAGPKILLGSRTRRAGKIFVDMTGGTGGSKQIFESMETSGINTLVCMHIGEDHREEAEKHHLNVVIAGHISSDNLGMNLLLDRAAKGSGLKIMGCSGFRRFERG
jgi:hypothetical protein